MVSPIHFCDPEILDQVDQFLWERVVQIYDVNFRTSYILCESVVNVFCCIFLRQDNYTKLRDY